MPNVTYSSEAERDVRQIIAYIAEQNRTAAHRWLEQLESTCHLLAMQPLSGERVKSTRFLNLRRRVVSNYLIFYVPFEDGVGIVRVLHSARDQANVF